MAITFIGKYSSSNNALRNETSSGVNSANLIGMGVRASAIERSESESHQSPSPGNPDLDP
jgi:hypothetical protein